MTDDPRTVAPSRSRFVRNADVAAERVRRLEGLAEGDARAALAIKALLATSDVLLMEVHREKGLVDVEHAHPDHDSICYLVRGRMRVVIDGDAFVADAGDAWVHHAGVAHYHEALEDCVQIEVKSPPRRTWD